MLARQKCKNLATMALVIVYYKTQRVDRLIMEVQYRRRSVAQKQSCFGILYFQQESRKKGA